MPLLKLSLLGQFQAALDDLPLEAFRSIKTRALLAYLVLEGKRPIARRQLATLFWEGYHPETARASLRSTLTNLRQLLGPLDVLTTTYRTVQFDVANSQVWCDAQLLTNLMEAGEVSTALDKARELYRGEFLAGFEEIDSHLFQVWLWERREYYRSLVDQRAPQQTTSVTPPVPTIPKIVAPSTTTRLPKALPSSKKEPGDVPVVYYLPEHTLGEKVAHNLPRRLMPVIGRTGELQQLNELLISTEYPLITILGEGGIGKSTVALEAARQVRPHFADGVWFIDMRALEHARDSSSHSVWAGNAQNSHGSSELHNWLAIAVGEAIGLSFHNTANPMVRLIARLRTAQMLLILDGYESFLESADFVLQLMRATERLKVLVTSRRPLNLMAEHRFVLPALSTPKAGSTVNERGLLAYPGIELFVRRAQAIQPNFELNAQNAFTITQICRLVGGLPLAIELAAVQVRDESCETILANLQHDFSTISSWMLDVPERHRNMQTVLASSWQLLNHEEARVMAACTVFRGTFSAEAAQRVVGATLSTLTALTEQSLLSLNGNNRFEMHDLVRQFAARTLHSTPNAEQAAHTNHASYYIAFLATQAQAMRTSAEAVQLIQAEMENVRVAWQWAVSNGSMELLSQGWQGLFEFYRVGGFAQEAILAAGRAVKMFQDQMEQNGLQPQQQRLLAMLLLENAHFHWKIGSLAEAEALARDALEIGRTLHTPVVRARGYYELSHMSVRKGTSSDGLIFGERGRMHARASGTADLEIMCLVALAMNSIVGHGYHAAIDYARTALERVESLNNLRLRAIVFTTQALSLSFVGEGYAAGEYYQQALEMARSLGDRHTLCLTLAYAAITLQELGQYQEARTSVEEAIALAREMDDRFLECFAVTFHTQILTRTNQLQAAQHAGEQAVRLAQSSQLHHLRLQAITNLGNVLVELGQYEAAEDTLKAALDLANQYQVPLWQGRVHAALAQLYLNQKLEDEALDEVKLALAEFPQFDEALVLDRTAFLLTCYQVMSATCDTKAEEILALAQATIQTQLSKIEDPAIRLAYRENVPANRKILAIAASKAISKSANPVSN